MKLQTLSDMEYNCWRKWNKKYPGILKSWDRNLPELTAFFEFPQALQTHLYTTNAVKGYYRMVRKFTKSKAIFPLPFIW